MHARVVTLQIDGQAVSARDDQSIFEVARENKVAIPKLCYVPDCRLRRMPALPRGGRRLEQAAARLRHNGQRRHAGPHRHPAAADYRRMILELLFAERNHVCSVCVSNGHCELQSWRRSWASTTSVIPTFIRRFRSTPAIRASSWIRTVAFCARAASGSATKSKARIPGT
jgi:predicted molibdopterin-dependent oxidoreductase YjgC